MSLECIAFDADDTLWHNETFYQAAKDRLAGILAPYADGEQVAHHLDVVEGRNIQRFGYGVKSYVLSMIETGIDLSAEKISGGEVRRIIELGKDMLSAEMQVLAGVEDTLRQLATAYPLMIITKGDLLDQESKLVRSGLGSYFPTIEVVSEKDAQTYRKILERHKIAPAHFLMVGNSLKSDILPVLDIGGWAVYVPYALTWSHEQKVDRESDSARYFQLDNIQGLPALLQSISI